MIRVLRAIRSPVGGSWLITFPSIPRNQGLHQRTHGGAAVVGHWLFKPKFLLSVLLLLILAIAVSCGDGDAEERAVPTATSAPVASPTATAVPPTEAPATPTPTIAPVAPSLPTPTPPRPTPVPTPAPKVGGDSRWGCKFSMPCIPLPVGPSPGHRPRIQLRYQPPLQPGSGV